METGTFEEFFCGIDRQLRGWQQNAALHAAEPQLGLRNPKHNHGDMQSMSWKRKQFMLEELLASAGFIVLGMLVVIYLARRAWLFIKRLIWEYWN